MSSETEKAKLFSKSAFNLKEMASTQALFGTMDAVSEQIKKWSEAPVAKMKGDLIELMESSVIDFLYEVVKLIASEGFRNICQGFADILDVLNGKET